MMSDLAQSYQRLTNDAGLAALDQWTVVELTGADRAAWLHNLCTNHIQNLPAGQACEAFLLTVQGKILGHVLVTVRTQSICLQTVPGQAQLLLEHLDRYLIREDVTLTDRTPERRLLYLGGPRTPEVLKRLGVADWPERQGQVAELRISGDEVTVVQTDDAGPAGWRIEVERSRLADVRQALMQAGAGDCVDQAFETARVEAGTPFYGSDITLANLPQEVGRDAQAINFQKGCYLGQEVVARIDALGHVNRRLCGVRFSGSDLPAVGSKLTQGGKEIGKVTSAVDSPRLGAPLALAYLRTGNQSPGTELESSAGPAVVVELPVRK